MSATAGQGPTDDRLMMAVLIASAVHMLLIFGISFDAYRSQPAQHQVEVTLVQTTGLRPDNARHIAQADQRGSGNEAQRELAAGNRSALPQAAASASPARLESRSGRARLNAPAITSARGERRIVDRRGEAPTAEDLPETDRELARLNEQLAQLEATLDSNTASLAPEPRVRRLEAVAARSAVDAAYLAEWRRRVETVGNQYYPAASLRYGIYGQLRMLVTVLADGRLESVRLLESSGYAVLDEAALRIVRLAAPFPPFPKELRETTDKLEIVRRWQFEQNPLSSK